jgi:hypothetical protein
MPRPPARTPHPGVPHSGAPHASTPHICDLRICEPLIATLLLLIALLTYGQALPAPFVPVPRPPAGVTVGRSTPTPVPAAKGAIRPSPIAAAVGAPVTPTTILSTIDSATAARSPTPAAVAGQPTSTPGPELQPTATTPAQEGVAPTPEPSPAPTREPASVPTVESSPTPTIEPSPTPGRPEWDLTQDVIGLWEHVSPDRQYYYDFLPSGTVFVAENGARPYRIEGDRTIIIQMPGNTSVLTVRDLSEDTLILEGVFGPSDEFHRQAGVPNLRQAMIGLWTDPDAENSPLEFTPGGIALGEFGRGTYRVVSNSHIFIECDDPVGCSTYREHAQPEDAPLSLRVYEIADRRITVLGLGYTERWTLERFEGYPTLAADIVGLWEDESGSTLRFTGTGDVERDDSVAGSYEVLSETTLWVSLGGSETAWMIAELDADTLSYTELDLYWEEPWVYSRVE